MQVNPDPLKVSEGERNNVTALAAVADVLKARTRGDRLRVWLALGGTEVEFCELTDSCEVCGGTHAPGEVCGD